VVNWKYIFTKKLHGDEAYGLGELGGRGRKARGDEMAGKPVSEWRYVRAGVTVALGLMNWK
jgi:hypothetical protein